MSGFNLQCAALVGSRICHDLISPIGAINNGMELLAMSGSSIGPELALIGDSVAAANARIRFFRIAYGAPDDAQLMGASEITAILRDVTRDSRLDIHWHPTVDVSRSEVQLGFLAIQCAEQALPYGGSITVSHGTDGTWQFDLCAERLTLDPDLWAHLEQDSAADQSSAVMPAHVQFLLLPTYAAAQGRQISVNRQATGASITL